MTVAQIGSKVRRDDHQRWLIKGIDAVLEVRKKEGCRYEDFAVGTCSVDIRQSSQMRALDGEVVFRGTESLLGGGVAVHKGERPPFGLQTSNAAPPFQARFA